MKRTRSLPPAAGQMAHRNPATAGSGSVAAGTRQRGAALIVGLVLMMVLTILAISTMRTSTLELAMAGNTQYAEQAEQLAGAGLKEALERIDQGVIVPVIVPGGPAWTTPFSQNVMTSDDTGQIGRYDVVISYIDSGPPPDNTDPTLVADFFEVVSTGVTSARNARATQVQGFYCLQGNC